MRPVGVALIGLAVLMAACGGGDGGVDGSATSEALQGALEAQLEAGLLLDFPLLTDEEAACIKDAVLANVPLFETALDEPDLFSELVLAGVAAAEERCLPSTTPEEPANESTPDGTGETGPVRSAIEDQLEAVLLRELPLLNDEEASCIKDAVLAELPDFESALDDPILFVDELLADIRAAQERCLSPERIAQLEAYAARVRTPEATETAFLSVVHTSILDIDANDEEIVSAGYLVCDLTQEVGGLDTLLRRLTATPRTSEDLAENLSTSLGVVLVLEELVTFSINAVLSLCPEYDN